MNGQFIYVIEGTFALGILGLIWKISTNTTSKMDNIAKDCNKRTENIFRRFDEYKETVKKDFVNKEVCNVVQQNLQRDVAEIKSDVKVLLRKNGIS